MNTMGPSQRKTNEHGEDFSVVEEKESQVAKTHDLGHAAGSKAPESSGSQATDLLLTEQKVLEEEKLLSEQKQLAEQTQLAHEHLLSEQKLFYEQKRLAEQTLLSEQKRLAEETLSSEQKLLTEHRQLVEQKMLSEQQQLAEQKLLIEQMLSAEERLLAQQKFLAEQTHLSEQSLLAQQKLLSEHKLLADQMQLLEHKQPPEQKQLGPETMLPEQEQLAEPDGVLEPKHGEQQKQSPEHPPAHVPMPPKKLVVAIAVIACVLGIIVSYPKFVEFMSTEETEDAYVTGHVHQIGSKIAGTIETVLVKDNQLVNKGQALATIDPRDEQVDLAKAQAHLDKVKRDALAAKHVVVAATRNYSAISGNSNGSISQSENAITRAKAGITTAEAEVRVAKQQLIQRQAQLRKTELDLERYTALASEGAVRTESLDAARRDHDVALADRDAAIQAIAQAESRLNQTHSDLKIAESQLVSANATALQADAANAQISVHAQEKMSIEATIKEAQADLNNAKLRLSYTKIFAPVSGRVGKKTVEEGQRIQPGTPLMAVVSSDKWVVANYKETQLKDMRPGQKVKICVDAFGGRQFNGHVESFSPASGASFAVLPPDNATGNFTKIVQRIPVKIVFDQHGLGEFEQLMSPGMSCVVKVSVR